MARRIRNFSIFIIAFSCFLVYGCSKYVLEIPHKPLSDSGFSADVAEQAVLIAMDLSSRDIVYSSKAEDFRDCSGVFHRLLNELRERCPKIRGPEKSSRTSKHIAEWYAAANRLSLIHDVFGQDWMIRPGAVMFYGKKRKHYRNITLEAALNEISHIGIVTSVNRGPNGKVISYELFHGRSKGKSATITGYHSRIPAKKKFQPLGNADQQWIGLAWLCNDASCDCAYANSNESKTLSAKNDMRARHLKGR